MKLLYYLKLEFITGPNQHEEVFDIFTEKYHEYKHYKDQIDSSNFDCQIPIHIFGSTNRSLNNSGSSNFGGPHIFKVQ